MQARLILARFARSLTVPARNADIFEPHLSPAISQTQARTNLRLTGVRIQRRESLAARGEQNQATLGLVQISLNANATGPLPDFFQRRHVGLTARFGDGNQVVVPNFNVKAMLPG